MVHHAPNDWGIRTKKKGTIILVASLLCSPNLGRIMIVGLGKFVPFPSTDYNIRSV